DLARGVDGAARAQSKRFGTRSGCVAATHQPNRQRAACYHDRYRDAARTFFRNEPGSSGWVFKSTLISRRLKASSPTGWIAKSHPDLKYPSDDFHCTELSPTGAERRVAAS